MFQDMFTKDRVAQIGAAIVVIALWVAVLLPGVFSHSHSAYPAMNAPAETTSIDHSVAAPDVALHRHNKFSNSPERDDNSYGELISGSW